MRQYILIALFAGLAAYGYSTYQGGRIDSGAELSKLVGAAPAKSRHGAYRCDGRTHCSQMRSCGEAMFFLENCPNTKMDGDHDRVPCERQWCGRQ